jgi:hypothetical protein
VETWVTEPLTANSVAVKFDLYNNNGEGPDSTALYLNGASPTTPAVDMTGSGIDLHSGDTFRVHMTYDGTNLAMTITDTITSGSFSITWPVNIPITIGANTAFAGFTGATGGYTSNQNILSWTMTSGASGGGGTVATPTFSPAAGTYLGTQTVTLSDTSSAAVIFYTLDGSQPGTSAGGSTQQYSGPLTVSSTETIKALATASGISTSGTASATYTIESQVATPTFSPAAGSYSSAQNGDYLYDILRSDDLLHHEWIHSDDQFGSVQRTCHGKRQRDVEGLRHQERLLR